MTRNKKLAAGAGVLALVGAVTVLMQDQVLQSQVTPDGRYLIEIIGAPAHLDTRFDLWSTRLIPPSPPKLLEKPPTDFDVSSFLLTPDSQHVVFRMGQTAQVAGGNWRLYVVSPDGSNRVNMTPVLVQGGNVENFHLLPRDWVHWTADAFQDETYLEFEASVAVAIFRDGFENGGVTRWL